MFLGGEKVPRSDLIAQRVPHSPAGFDCSAEMWARICDADRQVTLQAPNPPKALVPRSSVDRAAQTNPTGHPPQRRPLGQLHGEIRGERMAAMLRAAARLVPCDYVWEQMVFPTPGAGPPGKEPTPAKLGPRSAIHALLRATARLVNSSLVE